jgi:hypothetical protein
MLFKSGSPAIRQLVQQFG